MRDEDLLAALRRLKVETGSLVCVGCGYEHNCGIHGCRSSAKNDRMAGADAGRGEAQQCHGVP